MAFTLSARWPHGTYLAHRPDGSPEPWPTFARVFSALVHAAGVGSTAASVASEAADGFMRITPDAVGALTWLEANEPVGMALPHYPDLIPHRGAARTTGFRAEGVLQKEGGRIVDKKTARSIGTASWIGGSVRWFWEDTPPAEILAVIDALCSDVGTLGEADSPAILEIDTPEDTESRTHDLAEMSFFAQGGEDVIVPAPGRLAALESQFAAAHPLKRPSVAADRSTLSQSGLPRSEAPTPHGLTTLRLLPRERTVSPVPWGLAAVMEVTSGPVVPDEDRVAVAVALHRALIAAIGQECPPVVTGRYRSGEQPPQNRVALHYLPPGLPLRQGRQDRAHLAVLLPADIASTDADLIHRGLAQLGDLKTRIGIFRHDSPTLLDGDQFWQEPEEGAMREWDASPVAIPERSVKGADQAEVLARTVAWSLGNTMRGLFTDAGARSADERGAWMQRHGAELLEAGPRWVQDPTRFVHRTKRVIPVLPYRARLDLGTLVPPTAVLAIGQSRHLGGGLLVPVDRRPRKMVHDE
jgi:CRISPR-associated protein Csb2